MAIINNITSESGAAPEGSAGGDLSGSYPNPLVAKISGSSPVVITPASLEWATGTSNPNLTQVAPASDVAAQNLTIQSQSAYSSAVTNKNSGELVLASGVAAAGGHDGDLIFKCGSNLVALFDYDNASVEYWSNIFPGTDISFEFGIPTQRWTTLYAQLGLNGGTNTSGAGATMTVVAESAFAGSNSNGGLLVLQGGVQDGSGNPGIVQIFSGSHEMAAFDYENGIELFESVYPSADNFYTFGLASLAFSNAYTYQLNFPKGAAASQIQQTAQTTDVATNALTIQAQSAYTSATSNITGGNLVLSSGTGVVKGSEAASEAAGKLILQSGGNQQYGFDGYGMFCEQASVSVATTGTVNLTAAEVLCPYIVVSGTMTGNVTLQFPGTVASNTTRMWHLDLNGVVFATHTLNFTIGTGSTPASLTALTTNSNVVTLFAPSANVCYLNL